MPFCSAFPRFAKNTAGANVGSIVNIDLLAEPINWVIVFLVLYFLAISSQYVSTQLNAAGVNLL